MFLLVRLHAYWYLFHKLKVIGYYGLITCNFDLTGIVASGVRGRKVFLLTPLALVSACLEILRYLTIISNPHNIDILHSAVLNYKIKV